MWFRLGFGVQGFVFVIPVRGFRFLVFGVQSLGFRVWVRSLGFEVWGFEVWGLWFRLGQFKKPWY